MQWQPLNDRRCYRRLCNQHFANLVEVFKTIPPHHWSNYRIIFMGRGDRLRHRRHQSGYGNMGLCDGWLVLCLFRPSGWFPGWDILINLFIYLCMLWNLLPDCDSVVKRALLIPCVFNRMQLKWLKSVSGFGGRTIVEMGLQTFHKNSNVFIPFQASI